MLPLPQVLASAKDRNYHHMSSTWYTVNMLKKCVQGIKKRMNELRSFRHVVLSFIAYLKVGRELSLFLFLESLLKLRKEEGHHPVSMIAVHKCKRNFKERNTSEKN
jgi:hypothetical protein